MKTFNDLPVLTEKSWTYAGIGSRQTPRIVLDTITKLARKLEEQGYILNSGGAAGADKAFERGVLMPSCKNIFRADSATDETRNIACEIHPAPHALSGYVLDLMARNTFQIFGAELDRPVDFVVCWTPDGCSSHETRGRNTGGTGQAIEMASRKGIPVINMAIPGWQHRLMLAAGIK